MPERQDEKIATLKFPKHAYNRVILAWGRMPMSYPQDG